MNARSLIFLACTTVTFFCVHYYFDSKQEIATAQVYKQTNAEMAKALEIEEINNPITAKDLKEVSFYKNSSGTELHSYGVNIDGSYLLLSNKEYPDALYVKSGSEFQKIILLSSTAENSPAIYGKNTPYLELPSFSDNDTFYLLNTSEKDLVGYAKIKEKKVYTNLKTSSNALAFVKKEGKLTPVAIFDHQTLSLRPLKDYFSIRDFIVEKKITPGISENQTEEFYVLENEYQQLVFSTLGGSICEINLPLKTNASSKSLINPINFDRIMQEKHPENDLFPQNSYFTFKKGAKTKIEKGTLGGYYPLIRRSIYHKNGLVKKKIDPKFYAYNIISEHEKLENLNYKVVRFEKDLIEFEAVQPFRKIKKTYSLSKEKAPYCFNISITIDGPATDLYLSSGIPEVELQSGSFLPTLKYHTTEMGKSSVDTLSLPEKAVSTDTVNANWICNSNGFIGTIVNPITSINAGYIADKIDGKLVPSRLSMIEEEQNLYPEEKYPGYLFAIPLKEGTVSLRAFSGPFQKTLLKRLDQIFAVNSDNYTPDYVATKSSKGWFSFISEPFGQFLFFLMEFFYKLTSSWGISIILLTIALRLMLYPLNAWSIKANQRMQLVAPKIKELQEKYKKDPKRLQSEMMKLYREKGGSPFAGCLPVLIQLPFLFGMFELLKSTVELRGASFIPGWIPNLAAPDVLFSWSYHIPIIGTEFHLLPILTGLLMYVSQKMTMKSTQSATAKGSDQEKTQKMMAFMPLFMTVIFYNMPSGLNIYFISSTLLGIIQQKLMQKKLTQK